MGGVKCGQGRRKGKRQDGVKRKSMQLLGAASALSVSDMASEPGLSLHWL